MGEIRERKRERASNRFQLIVQLMARWTARGPTFTEVLRMSLRSRYITTMVEQDLYARSLRPIPYLEGEGHAAPKIVRFVSDLHSVRESSTVLGTSNTRGEGVPRIKILSRECEFLRCVFSYLKKGKERKIRLAATSPRSFKGRLARSGALALANQLASDLITSGHLGTLT